jgi:hypothetical protein
MTFGRDKPDKLFEPERLSDLVDADTDLGFLQVLSDFPFR